MDVRNGCNNTYSKNTHYDYLRLNNFKNCLVSLLTLCKRSNAELDTLNKSNYCAITSLHWSVAHPP